MKTETVLVIAGVALAGIVLLSFTATPESQGGPPSLGNSINNGGAFLSRGVADTGVGAVMLIALLLIF